MYLHSLNKYKNSLSNTLTGRKQVALIYGKIIYLIEKSKNSIQKDKSPERFIYIENAKNIVENMFIILDNQVDEYLAKTLRGFYFKIHNDISYLKCTKDIEHYDSIIKELKIVQDEWNS